MELLSNNAVNHFIKIYIEKEDCEFKSDRAINQRRYHILTFKKYKSEPVEIFFKFTEKPYLSAEGGFSESINREHIKEVMKLYNQKILDYCYICYKDGNIYRIKPSEILEHGYIESDSEGTEKYIFNIKLMERYNEKN